MADEANNQLPIIAKRKPPSAGRGRKKGEVNKITRAIKDMILGALDDVGGQAYLTKQATANPTAFMGLLAKIMPTQVVGDPTAPVYHVIEERIVDPR